MKRLIFFLLFAVPTFAQSNITPPSGGGGSGNVSAAGTLTSNAVVLGGGGTAVATSAGFTTDGTSQLTLGVSGTSQAALFLSGQNSAETTNFTGRIGVGIPVPYLTPTATTSQIALDTFPHGAPTDFSATTGVAWHDICDGDVIANNPNYECLRLGIFASGAVQLSEAHGGTGTVHNMNLQALGGAVGIGGGVSGSGLLAVTNNADTSKIPVIEFDNNGVTKAYVGTALASGNFFTDTAANDLVIKSLAFTVRLGSNTSTVNSTMQITNGNPGIVQIGGALALTSAGGHINTQAASTDVSGTIAISGATSASHSFGTAYTNAPNCTLTPTSDPTAVGVWWATTATGSVTANIKVSGTITFVYHCFAATN